MVAADPRFETAESGLLAAGNKRKQKQHVDSSNASGAVGSSGGGTGYGTGGLVASP